MLTQQSTIHGKYQGKTGYLLGNVDVGIGEFAGMGYCVDDMQTTQTIESQLMMWCGSHTDTYTTINDTWEISQEYQLFTQEC